MTTATTVMAAALLSPQAGEQSAMIGHEYQSSWGLLELFRELCTNMLDKAYETANKKYGVIRKDDVRIVAGPNDPKRIGKIL